MLDLIVTLSPTGAGVNGEAITVTCTDSAAVPNTVGTFSASPGFPLSGTPVDTFTVPSGSTSGKIRWNGATTPVLPVRCTAIGSTDFVTRSAEFIFYNGARWAVAVHDRPLCAGCQTTATAEVFPDYAISVDMQFGHPNVTFTLECDGLDVIGAAPAARRLLSTSVAISVGRTGPSLATWSLTGPAQAQTFTCTWTRSGGLSYLPAQKSLVVDMAMSSTGTPAQASSSGLNGGASSSTGGCAVGDFNCDATVNARSSWLMIALAFAAVVGALTQ